MTGGDVGALRALAGAIRRTGNDIGAVQQRLEIAVDAFEWIGPDRDEFVRRWRHEHSPNLSNLIGELDSVASAAAYHAARQEQASRRTP